MLDEHLSFVARTLRRAGVPPSDIEDQVQRTFIITADRLDDLQLASERGFLFQVARNLAAHVRRTLAHRREISSDRVPERIAPFATPEHLIDRKRMGELVEAILDDLGASVRSVFVLHVFEEMTMTEIAATLRIPRGTVASRLRAARRRFRKHTEVAAWCREGTA
jgi:RNA polymerase sigma-70 factor (ECF subfamily)